MATHSSILAWRIPWTEEPGGLQSMGLHRVGHNLVTKQQQCIYVNATLSICPTLFLLYCVRKSTEQVFNHRKKCLILGKMPGDKKDIC